MSSTADPAPGTNVGPAVPFTPPEAHSVRSIPPRLPPGVCAAWPPPCSWQRRSVLRPLRPRPKTTGSIPIPISAFWKSRSRSAGRRRLAQFLPLGLRCGRERRAKRRGDTDFALVRLLSRHGLQPLQLATDRFVLIG